MSRIPIRYKVEVSQRTEQETLSLARLLIAKEPASISKQFMCSFDSSRDHEPPVETGPYRAPQPSRLASDSNARSGADVKIVLPFQASKWLTTIEVLSESLGLELWNLYRLAPFGDDEFSVSAMCGSEVDLER
ncbi:hypothetical protein NDU88_010644 [Pleurodeles waltl]|uniref:Uncharacterized protein n=1 Tax=Pleurodeles waltl TaxID=8319 RepID=A0AAV7QV02_PLEWA|nr:hypothetical protein NDU88_010644 [Pleurodeles waltl]